MSERNNTGVLLLVLITIVGIIMASQSGTPQKNTLSGGLNLEQGNNQLIGTDNANLARLLVQSNSDGFNMKVSKDGYDARTAADENLVFNSDRNLFKIIDQGSVTVTIPGGYSAAAYQENVDITYSVNTRIVVSAVVPPYVSASDRYNLPVPAMSVIAGAVKWQAYSTTGTDYLAFTVDLQATGLSGVVGDWVFTYFVLEQTAL